MIIRIFIIALFFISTLPTDVAAQTGNTIEEAEKRYNANIRKSKIDGVYIPENIGDAIQEIIRLSPAESIQKFKGAEENFVVRRLHFGLGKWIAENWSFYEGSRYSHYLRQKGITHADDMIDFTLRSLHRHLNNVPLEIEERAQMIREKRKAELEKKLNNAEVIDSMEIKHDSTTVKKN